MNLNITRSFFCLSLLILMTSGCTKTAINPLGPHGTVRLPDDARLPTGSKPPPQCSLRLHVELNESPYVHAYDAVDGLAGACIKRHGQPLKIPEPIMLVLGNGQDVDEDYVFDVLWRRNASPICNKHDLRDGKDTCPWNGTVRDKFPLSLRLTAEEGVLSDHLQLVRLYLNGALTFAWSGLDRKKEVVIPYKTYARAKNLPYGAQLDLQVVPKEIAVDPNSVPPNEAADRFGWIARAAKEALGAAKAAADPSTVTMLECLEYEARAINATLQALAKASSSPSFGQAPGNCGRIDFPADHAVLERYFSALGDNIALAEKDTEEAEKILRRIGDWVSSSESIDVAPNAAAPDGALQTLQYRVAQLKEVLRESGQLVSGSRQFVARSIQASRLLVLEAKQIHENSKIQAQMFADFAARLDAAGGPFEERRANPAPIAGSSTLFMNYSDVFQTFVLAPWSGLPVRLFDTGNRAELSAGNAIPIVDVFGMRWQWREHRFADFRVGVGAFYLPDKYLKDGVRTDVYNPGAEFNVAIANLHLGYGYVLGSKVSESTWRERSRLMIGVDLYKLVTGENLEAK